MRKVEYRNVFTTHLAPLFSASAKQACSAVMPSSNRLVVHLRSGDILKSNHIQSVLAPCAFFDYIISSNGFGEVHIVTERDFEHPCINATQERHPETKFTVQSKTFEEDACVLMRARYLAMGSPSTFSSILALLNNDLLKVFVARAPGD